MQISQALQAIASNLGLEYLRATDPQANEELGRKDLNGLTIMIYNNLPDVEYNVYPYLEANYPVQVKIMKLASFDDNTVDTDIIQDSCRTIAEQVARDLMSYDDTIIAPETFLITSQDNVELFDDILTGVTLEIDIKYTINCPPPPPSSGIFDNTFDNTFN